MHCGMKGGFGGGCCQGSCGGGRRFFTKKEQMERLQEYAKMMEKELIGVKEHIAEIQKKKNYC